jgi:hypothetical protein
VRIESEMMEVERLADHRVKVYRRVVLASLSFSAALPGKEAYRLRALEGMCKETRVPGGTRRGFKLDTV